LHNLQGVAKPIYWNHNPSGYIYFIQMDRIGPIKIGYAKDIKKRLISLQISSPYPLKLLCHYKADVEHEKEWHQAFEFIRLKGEWFLPHPFLLKQIRLVQGGIQ